MTPPRWLPWLAAAFLLLLITSMGWVSDDAYVTLRSVDLTWQGYGPVYNIDERVQGYTHPLWFGVLLLTYGLTGNPWLAAFLPALAATGLTLALVVLAFRDRPWRALVALGGLTAARAFLEYSTSGLENPLTHLCLAGIVAARLQWPGTLRLFAVAALTGIALVNRLDSAVLVVPLFVATLIQDWDRGWPRVLASGVIVALPLAVWELFSLVYYGVPVPNTAYAKLATGLPIGAKISMGSTYLTHYIVHDPTGALLIAVAMIGTLLAGHKATRPQIIAILLYLAYILWIGGDFMAGRFLAAPALLAAMVIADLPRPHALRAPVAIIATWVLAVLGQAWFAIAPQRLAQERALVESGPYEATRLWGIVDERSYFRSTLGFWAALSNGFEPQRITRTEGEALAKRALVQPQVAMPAQTGVYGFYAGPNVYVVDLYGLGDPLIARLPMTTTATQQWAPGHFPRAYPEGYVEGRGRGLNTIKDPDLAAYYETLRSVVSDPVFSASRAENLWKLHTGQMNGRLRAYTDRLGTETP
ncbi:MAG: hypothetical protein AB8H79_21570 [Myxococcota bacterium]